MKRWVMLWLLALCLGTAAPLTAQPPAGAPLAPSEFQEKLERLREIQARHQDRVLQIPGIVGIGIGLDPGGTDLCFVVYAERITDEIRRHLGTAIETVPVRLLASGELRAF